MFLEKLIEKTLFDFIKSSSISPRKLSNEALHNESPGNQFLSVKTLLAGLVIVTSAQTSVAQESPRIIEEVVVTASKRVTSVRKIQH